ncbi:hypothetical protein JG687_00001980 [Phytophthora cactorum]|uniref:Reverse transcriptase/retrotransposon-derived protein RNase H-like domain-containing protein n=1 Tax=Phytophthora cactorum TaxID=29920 RepID=A0A329SEM1_9STRA|nr:hypothetical protein PC117_g6097 [Phytophthora cactorum]KAG3078338.1 hypothetical protein PC121_g7240 [Phytophthora cactorum]KAG4059991.1 hypothetical protein PC123_g5109 [Phytophthora cactorum]KAG6971487.1 hypothetical protein JG687_00001980 [Phytophthora cactorum]RAW35234.1 hypothetical protein PC110_g8438 [Phytophthora cactorum]
MRADHSKPFHVVRDVSAFAIGCALMQFDDEGRKRGVSYWSRQFKAVEWNYPIYDKALLAMRNVLIKLPDGEDGRERARDIASTQLNGVPNRTVAKPATQGIFTSADTGAVASATPGLTEPRVDTGATPTNARSLRRTSGTDVLSRGRRRRARTLMGPGQQHRVMAYRDVEGAAGPATASFANFDPNTGPPGRAITSSFSGTSS